MKESLVLLLNRIKMIEESRVLLEEENRTLRRRNDQLEQMLDDILAVEK